ncbi:stress protein [Clostridium sp. HBUAS56017]|uniref:stress protein n=1 Tax=Clostridium sp. HBUAS56017 TaxID=2571128 RepID=UPI001177EFF5|nr:stress protein [Clostridium sp. HBUAS56017]
MKKIKMKVITVCLALGMVATTMGAPTVAYAASKGEKCTISNGIETSVANNNDAKNYNFNQNVDAIYGASKAWAPGINFNVSIDVLGIANRIASEISRNNFNGQRAAFCKNLMETAFYAAGGRYNVVVFDLSQNYNYRLSGVKMYAGYQFDGTTFGVWIFDRNQPRGSYFRNDGRRGWDHWACRGWQRQEDNVMWYNK